ncbi:hypothetical protein G6F32_016341 [Rhizopus arrhizus]|nr:hypothetical protein G6F32_016341 [Rhizopus arrhizus]
MRPPSLTWRPASVRKNNAAFALHALSSSYSASRISSNGVFGPLPTVLMAMSGRPTAATASANKRSIAAAEVRSPRRATDVLPAACTAATVASASAWVAALL